jgi:hypothetical protein
MITLKRRPRSRRNRRLRSLKYATRSTREWKIAMNRFTILCDERFTIARP